MRRLVDALRLAIERRRVERVLAALHARNLTILTICVDGRYKRIYVDHKYGMVMLTPEGAARYLRAIEIKEFERAISTDVRKGGAAWHRI